MKFSDFIKQYFKDVDEGRIRVNFHTTDDNGVIPEDLYMKNNYRLDFVWNNWVINNDYSIKTNIYVISFYQLKENNKHFVLNGIFYVDENKHFWKLYDQNIYKQYGKLKVEYENRKNNYPTLATVIEKGCEIIYIEPIID